MSISLNLYRPVHGAEILKAFRDAATFQEDDECRWVVVPYGSSDGVITDKTTFSAKQGFFATPEYLFKQGWLSRLFFGDRGPQWKAIGGLDMSEFMTQIKLHAVQPENTYRTVALSLTHLGLCSDDGIEFDVIRDPDHWQFRPHRAAYDRIIKNFMAPFR